MLHSSYPLGQFFELAEGLMSLPNGLGDYVKWTPIYLVPILDKNKKFELNADLQAKKKGRKILLKYGMKINCNADLFKPIPVVLLESNYSSMTELTVFVLQCLEWSYDTKYKGTLEEFQYFIKTTLSLERKVPSMHYMLEFSIKKVLNYAINSKKPKFSDEVICDVIDFFEKTQILTKKTSKILTQYVFTWSSKSEDISNRLISMLMLNASQKKNNLINSDLCKIVQCFTGFLNDLNPKFIMFIAYLNPYAPMDIIASIYQFLPNVLYSKIPPRDPPAKKRVIMKSFNNKERKNEDFVFYDLPFDFSSIDSFQFSTVFSFNDSEIMDYVSIVANGLICSQNVYRDIFFASALKLYKIKNIENMNVFSCLLIIIFKIVSIDYPIPNAYSVVAESYAVRSKQNIFQFIDPDIDYARSILFDLVCRNHPELVIDLFRRFSQTPYLVAEFICRLRHGDISKVDFSLMIDDDNISILKKSLNQLMLINNAAKDIVFYFLIFLATDHKSANSWFSSKLCVGMFMELLFNRSAQKDILNSIQVSLSTFVTLSNLLQFATALNTVIDACIGAQTENNEEYINLALEIFNALKLSIIHQPLLLRHFVHILDKYITLCAIHQKLFEILDFIMVLSQSSNDFCVSPFQLETLIPILKKQYGDDPPEFIFRQIYKCVSYGEFDSDCLRDVRNHMNLPFLLASFGLSPRITDIIKYFIKLTEKRPSSIDKLSNAGLTQVLLNFFTGDGSEKVISLDLFKYKILIPPELYDDCFMLIKRMIIKSCKMDLLAILTKALYGRFSTSVLEVVEDSIAVCIGNSNTKFSIGYQPVQLVLALPITNLVNDSFSLEFKLNIDTTSAHFAEDEFNLIRFIDEENSSLNFSLYHGMVYATNDNKYSKNIVNVARSLNQNQVAEFPLVIKAEDNIMKITKLMEQTLPMVSEIYFQPMVGNYLKVIVGGLINPSKTYIEDDTSFGTIFDIKIHSEKFTNYYEIQGKKALYDFSNPESKYVSFAKSTVSQTILDLMIESSYADVFCSFFNKESDTDFYRVFSILKMILPVAAGCPEFETIRKFLDDKKEEMLTFKTFRILTDIHFNLPHNEIKENFFRILVGNIDLWYKSVDFNRILDYIIRYLSKVTPFDVKYSLEKYLSLFSENKNLEIKEKFILYVYSVLHYIDSKSTQYLLDKVFDDEIEDEMKLQLLDFTIKSDIVLDENEKYLTMKKIVKKLSNKIEETVKFIHLLIKISGEKSYIYMFTCAKKIENLGISKLIFDKIYENFTEFPQITYLLAILSLKLSPSEKEASLTALLWMAMNCGFTITDDQWAIVPIIVYSQIPHMADTFSHFLFLMSTKPNSKKQNSPVQTFLTLKLFSLTITSLDKVVTKFVEYCIDQYYKDIPNMLNFLLFSSVFIWPNVQPMNARLREDFAMSPFAENLTPELNLPQFSPIETVEGILNFLSSINMPDINIRFKVRFEDDFSWKDRDVLSIFEKILKQPQVNNDVSPQLKFILEKYCNGQVVEEEKNTPEMQVSVIYVIENALTTFKSLFTEFAPATFRTFGETLFFSESL
ncbi:hypothetical protein TVAG_403780 [Trichomonas vaginalis G3]|uniref:Beige/BEACH domain containing protein n=1 Tax=Trichomonas vaginalis (strain ATCC PRA-98 / G3) TaxID=412133 RepID=A2ELQ6_TRIV3|nr:aggrephagy protein [Trichomonas vaginalis G3]EAY06421.1 hypothetical protein TVAG_403780 [Trichomonas vaginalis G3]KAI5503009.1 aggrephagy protein [Trichomonas vaginalis G3]|eukprot:XP_001318644.1 hypothetical protein [Trichomonas vaginalis G3]